MSHTSAHPLALSCVEYTEGLTRLQSGLLADADAEVAQQHLYACPNCRLLTHQVEAVTDLVGDVEPPPVHKSVLRLLDDIAHGTAVEPRDPGAIAQLLLGLAKSLDPHGAEDLVQQTLLAALEERPGKLDLLALAKDLTDRAFGEPSSPVRSLDDYRTRAESEAAADPDSDADTADLFYPDFYDIGPDVGRHVDTPNHWGRINTLSPDDEVLTHDLLAVVDSAIGQLADPLGQLIQLVDVDDVPLMDAAHMLRLDHVDAADALNRARLHLRGVVDEYMAARA